MSQKHPIVRMGRRQAADAHADARAAWERINAAYNEIRALISRADDLETWLGVYETTPEPGPVRELALERLETLLGIKE